MTDTDTTADQDDQAALRDRVADYVTEHGPISFGEIADALGVNRQLVRVRLREAVSDGRIARAGSRRGRTLWAAATPDAMNQPPRTVQGVTAVTPPADTTPQSAGQTSTGAPPDLDDADDAGARDEMVRAEIAKHPDGVTTSAVAAALDAKSDQVYNSIRRLRDDGVVTKKTDPNDKRTSLWTVSGE